MAQQTKGTNKPLTPAERAFAAWLASQLKRLDIPQVKLATATKCSATMINHVLAGRRRATPPLLATALVMLHGAGAFAHPNEVMAGMQYLGYSPAEVYHLVKNEVFAADVYLDAYHRSASLVALQEVFLSWWVTTQP